MTLSNSLPFTSETISASKYGTAKVKGAAHAGLHQQFNKIRNKRKTGTHSKQICANSVDCSSSKAAVWSNVEYPAPFNKPPITNLEHAVNPL